jgi:hypothetical protein
MASSALCPRTTKRSRRGSKSLKFSRHPVALFACLSDRLLSGEILKADPFWTKVRPEAVVENRD